MLPEMASNGPGIGVVTATSGRTDDKTNRFPFVKIFRTGVAWRTHPNQPGGCKGAQNRPGEFISHVGLLSFLTPRRLRL